MMMDIQTTERMMGGMNGWMSSFMWINYLLFLALAVLGIIALIKYIGKK